MKRIRYLAMMVLLMCSITLLAQPDSGFNPANPAEPSAPNIPRYSMLTLVADPVGGGTPTTSGKIAIGSKVTLNANKAGNFRFVNWTDAQGNVVSTSESYQITKGEEDEVYTAHYIYIPPSPAEPSDPWLQLTVQLNVVAAEGGSVSGGGKYLPGTDVTLNASPAGSYVFKEWRNEQGEVLSTNRQFTYQTKNVVETLTAYFTFVPPSPSEPAAPDVAPRYHVNVVATEGGTVSASTSGKQGENITVSSNCNGGYEFVGWYKDGVLYNSNRSFTYTITAEDVTFEARFRYNPASPGEPSIPGNAKRYVFYIENANGFVNEPMDLSVFLFSLNAIGNITFQMSFPESLVPQEGDMTYSERLAGYEKVCTKVSATEYKFEFTGGEMQAGNGPLVTFRINVPEDYPTGTRNPVRMNQISFMEVGGSSTTAIARNANIGVFKSGDVNGDNVIDIGDIHAIKQYRNGLIDVTDGFIVEAADVDKNGNINEDDEAMIIAIATDDETMGEPVASDNAIFVKRFDAVAGATTADEWFFPVTMTNADDVWGVQFDVLLPEEMTIDRMTTAPERMGEGEADFTMLFSTLQDGWQRVFLMPAAAERFIPDFEGDIRFFRHFE